MTAQVDDPATMSDGHTRRRHPRFATANVAHNLALVEKIDAGPKGATLTFRGGQFPNPIGLVKLINEHQSTMKVRPDQKVVISRDWTTPEQRLKGAQALLGQLAKIAQAG